MRDRKTLKSRGFAFVAYVDQRSTELAVDNLNGSVVCGRPMKVDHVRDFKIPRENTRIPDDFDPKKTIESLAYKPSGPDGRGWGNFREMTEDEVVQVRELEESTEIREQREAKGVTSTGLAIQKQKIDVDEMWEENMMRQLKQYENTGLNEIKEKMKLLKEEKKRMKKLKKSKKDKKEKKSKKIKEAKSRAG